MPNSELDTPGDLLRNIIPVFLESEQYGLMPYNLKCTLLEFLSLETDLIPKFFLELILV